MLSRLPRQDISNSQGSLMLFTDECCHDPISESSVPLISGDCQGAPFSGIKSVVLTSLPTCPDYGLPLLIVSNETSCRNPQSESTANSGVIGKCQSFLITEISSFQFICYGKGVSSVPPPSTTTSSQGQYTPSTTAWAESEIQETPTPTPTSTDLDGTQSETHWTPTSTNWDETQSQTWWTPTSTDWDGTQGETWWTPTSSSTRWMPTSSRTWWTRSGWGGTYEAGPTLTIIPIEKGTKDPGADGRSWFTLTVTMNNTVYEVRQPTVEYGLVREESLSCNSGDMVSHRNGAPVLVCLVTIWLLISLSLL
ncbi:hypothetical protein GGR51DRAFT_496554 [Nemania sp. FL0031]|nr:hypothetical protein GGR51DRAFT_496554 [Nemania sp. FL0031]